MINLRVRFQPFEDIRLSLNGAFSEFANLNHKFANPNSEIRFRVNPPILNRRLAAVSILIHIFRVPKQSKVLAIRITNSEMVLILPNV
jgi:hypothetical protein